MLLPFLFFERIRVSELADWPLNEDTKENVESNSPGVNREPDFWPIRESGESVLKGEGPAAGEEGPGVESRGSGRVRRGPARAAPASPLGGRRIIKIL